MKFNTSKFQAMVMKPCASTDPIMVDISGQSVQPSDYVKLLRVNVDAKLRFRNRISVICDEHRGKLMLSTGYQFCQQGSQD